MINKVDRGPADTLATLHAGYPDAVFISARTGKGIERLRLTIESLLPRPEIEIRRSSRTSVGTWSTAFTRPASSQHRAHGHWHLDRRSRQPLARR